MKKRIISLIIVLCLFIPIIAQLPIEKVFAAEIVESGTCGDDLSWTLDSEGVLIIEGSGLMPEWEWNGSPWYSNKDIKEVIIYEGFSDIGRNAFYGCGNIRSVTIPEGVKTIGESAFNGCNTLSWKNIFFPDSLTKIEETAFFYCGNFTSVSFPQNVIYVGDSAFAYCSNLRSVSLNDKLEYLGEYVFAYCKIDTLNIPAGLTKISADAFQGCEYLSYISVDEDNDTLDSRENCNAVIETETNKLVLGSCNTSIPEDVTCIGRFAFEGRGIEEIDIPASVKKIEEYAFKLCTSLKSVSFTENLTDIGDGAFYYCSNLSDITIPSSISHLSDELFYYCYSLNKVFIPDSITNIGEGTFAKCSSLTDISLPNSVTDIGDRAFYYCSSLKKINISENVKSIGEEAFGYCTSITNIYLPDSITELGIGVFEECSSLSSVNIPNNITELIGTFRGCTSLTNIVLPKNISKIGDGTFLRCSNLKTIDNLDYVKVIGASAFESCSSLLTVSFSNELESIGLSAFEECNGLSQIIIPKNTKVGSCAFSRCNSILSVVINNLIDTWAFAGCSALVTIYVPASVDHIEDDVFANCNIQDVYYGGNKEKWEGIKIGTDNYSIGEANIHYNSSEMNIDDLEDPSEGFYFTKKSTGEFWNTELSNIAITSKKSATLGGYVEWDSVVDEASSFAGITWEISDPSVAEIKNTSYTPGLSTDKTSLYWTLSVNGLKPGKVTITGTTADGRTATSPVVTVEPAITAIDNKDTIGTTTAVKLGKVELDNIDADFLQSFLSELTISTDETKINILDTSYEISDDGMTGYIIGTVAPKATGDVSYTITSPGGQSVSGNLNLNYYNELIYQAQFLMTNETPAEGIRKNMTIDTPAKRLLDAAAENNLDLSVGAWVGVTGMLDAINDPNSVVSMTFYPKDIYSGIIMNVLDASLSIDLIDDMYENTINDSKKFISHAEKLFKTYDKIDLKNKDVYKNLTSAQRQKMLEMAEEWYDSSHIDLSDAFWAFDAAFDMADTIEDFTSILVSYITVANMDGYMKEVLRAGYAEAQKTDNTPLIQAFQECTDIINNNAVLECINKECFVIGKKAAGYLFKELVWNNVKKSLSPEVAFMMAAYSAAKGFTNFLFGTDDIKNAYYNLKAVYLVEDIFRKTETALKSKFESDHTVDSAGAYLASLNLVFSAIDTDCDKSYKFVDTVDSAAYSWIVKFFTGNDYSEQKASIMGWKSLFQSSYESGSNAWKNYLEGGFNPFTGKNDFSYVPDLSKDDSTLKKQVSVACPVDVYVYNSSDKLVASVVGGVLTCDDDNLMIARIGDEKVIRFYTDSEKYSIEYIGTDNGTMDIEVEEFDEEENVSRVCSYDDVELSKDIHYEMDIPAPNDQQNAYTLENQDNGAAIIPEYDTKENSVYTAKIRNGLIEYKDGLYLDTEIPAGARAMVQTEEQEGYEFIGWQTSDGRVVFDDEISLTTSFVMPSEDVVIEAVFRALDPEYLLGDVNGSGDVTAEDLTALARHVAKIEIITDTSLLKSADVTSDGNVTADDLTKLARFVAKIISTLE